LQERVSSVLPFDAILRHPSLSTVVVSTGCGSGAGNSYSAGPEVIVVSNYSEFQDAIAKIRSGQTIRLDLEEIHLEQGIELSDLTDIALEGMKNLTKIRCPVSGSALSIRYT